MAEPEEAIAPSKPPQASGLTPEEALAFASNLNQVFNVSRATSQPRGADSGDRD